jgi:hypothetical protein
MLWSNCNRTPAFGGEDSNYEVIETGTVKQCNKPHGRLRLAVSPLRKNEANTTAAKSFKLRANDYVNVQNSAPFAGLSRFL